jgi:hypothetical protein
MLQEKCSLESKKKRGAEERIFVLKSFFTLPLFWHVLSKTTTTKDFKL